ncbi:hypothetical protein APSETT445_004711 [Aspergillus pseudonomiae]
MAGAGKGTSLQDIVVTSITLKGRPSDVRLTKDVWTRSLLHGPHKGKFLQIWGTYSETSVGRTDALDSLLSGFGYFNAPTPDDPKFAYWRHWVVSGLQPSGAPETVQTLTEYLGPGPKDDSRPHRYLFLLFREPHSLSLSKEDVGGEEFTARRSFKAAEWVQQHGLELVAVNWMLGAGDGWHE